MVCLALLQYCLPYLFYSKNGKRLRTKKKHSLYNFSSFYAQKKSSMLIFRDILAFFERLINLHFLSMTCRIRTYVFLFSLDLKMVFIRAIVIKMEVLDDILYIVI